MGLFDKRPPCAICGGKVKGLLPWKIEGNYICNDCYGVVDAQDGNSFNMKQFLEYRDFREQNHALKDQFHIDETVEFGFFSEKFVFDYQNNLFCMDKGLDRTIFHGSELESFLISEDGAPLLEGSARGYIRHQSTVPQRINDLLPQMNQLLLQQQPVARDLRQISAALKMITDMERIGDQAQDIAEIVTFLKGRTAEHDDILCQMARATISMVTESVDAFVKHDTIKAEAVLAADDTVDAYFRQVKQALISRIAADPADGEYALDLLMIAKYFERIGDHATNIAEWVMFSVTGVHKTEAT